VYGIKSNSLAKYVELPVEGLRTRVQFPPSPPTKQKAHPCGGLFVLLGCDCTGIESASGTDAGWRALNKQHLRAVCSPERQSLASDCAACKVTSEHGSRRTPEAKRTAVPKGRGCRGCNATTEQFPHRSEHNSPNQFDSRPFYLLMRIWF
jgi:hypothetical protein